MQVISKELEQNVVRYLDAALRAPVAITKNGCPHAVLMSAVLFEIITKGRIVRSVEDLDDDMLRVMAAGSVEIEHTALDELITDWIS
jgi:hypothetical protein